jgi:hypothetical protein
MAASTQALITLGSASSPEQSLSNLSNLSSTHLTNEAKSWLRARLILFCQVLTIIPQEPKETPKDPEQDLYKNRLRYAMGYYT